MRCALVLLSLVLLCGTAHALLVDEHREITRTACWQGSIPLAFCDRAGQESYQVDASEFYVLSAHAQRASGQSLCAAADAAATRLYQLGKAFRAAAFKQNAAAAARALGRAMHTLQDSCAHHGMSNPEHAWWTMMDQCQGTQLSPDADPQAETCARRESWMVIPAVVATLNAAPITNQQLDQTIPILPSQPGPDDACNFLAEAASWNGHDLTWDRDRVAPLLRTAFVRGLNGQSALGAVCASGGIASPHPQQTISVVSGTPSCMPVHVLCGGKADQRLPSALSDEPASEEVAGCTMARGPLHPAGICFVLLALLGAALLGRRRR